MKLYHHRASCMELDYVATATRSDGGDRVSNSKNPKELGLGACIGSEDDWDSETEPKFSEMEREIRADNHIERCSDSCSDFDDHFYEFRYKPDEKKMGMAASKEEKRVPDYESFLSEFDDYAASEKMGSGVSRALSYGFEVGDMVWGKVKSHPWWPGQIFNEAFASPSVRRMRRIGCVLVAFFGDSSYGWFDPAELIPFEPHVAEKSQQTSSSNFAKAVEEAVDEAARRSALGLTCKCRNPRNFRPANVQGYFAVDVPDYEPEAVYSSKQIRKARDCFSSAQTLSFVKRCALAPQECDSGSLKFYQRKAAVCALRRAVFEEFDETYEHAFRARSAYTSVKTHEPLNRAPPRAPLSGSLFIAETLGDSKSSNVQGISGPSFEDNVLQRKTPYLQTPMNHDQTRLVSMDFTSSSGYFSGKEYSVSKLSRDIDKGLAQESNVRMGEKAALIPNLEQIEALTRLKQDETRMHSRSNRGFLRPYIERKCSAGVGINKVNVLKRSSGEMDSENAPTDPKKKQKKKSDLGSELNRDSSDKRKALSSGEGWVKKSSQLGSAERHPIC